MIASGVKSFKISKWFEGLGSSGGLRVPAYILGMISDYNIGNEIVQLKGHYDDA